MRSPALSHNISVYTEVYTSIYVYTWRAEGRPAVRSPALSHGSSVGEASRALAATCHVGRAWVSFIRPQTGLNRIPTL